jgi:hypothetical protein
MGLWAVGFWKVEAAEDASAPALTAAEPEPASAGGGRAGLRAAASELAFEAAEEGGG